MQQSKVRLSWLDTGIESDGNENNIQSTAHELMFDAVEAMNISSEASITKLVIESGATISDHKRAQPKRITLKARVSNDPIGAPLPSGTASETIISAKVTKTDVGNVIVYSNEFDRVQDVFDSLQTLVEHPILVLLETPNKTYDNLTVTSVTDDRTGPHYRGASFDIILDEIQSAETQTTTGIVVPRQPRGQPAANTAAVAAQEEAPETESVPDSVNESVLHSVFN